MDTSVRLKLVRSLAGLTQREMANLMGISHFYVSSIEESKRKMPVNRAELLAVRLGIDTEWLTGGSTAMLANTRFTMFSFDGSKAVGSTITSQKKNILISSKFIKEHLPDIFAGSEITYRYFTADENGNGIFFVIFSNQGFLVKVMNCKEMITALHDVMSLLLGPLIPMIPETEGIFESIAYSTPVGIRQFIELHDIAVNQKKRFIDATDKHCRRLFQLSGEAKDEFEQTDSCGGAGVKGKRTKKPLKTLEEATKAYALEQRVKILNRIIRDIKNNEITLTELGKMLIEEKRGDLL